MIVDFEKLASAVQVKDQPEPFWQWGFNNSNRGKGCADTLRNLPPKWQRRYFAAVGSATALPNKPPCTADFFYLGPSAALSWREIATLFANAHDEACLGAMLALASTSAAKITWLPQPLGLWNLTYDLVVDSSSSSSRQHLRTANEITSWSSFASEINTSDSNLKKLLFIENSPDVILAHPLKPSVEIVRDWMLKHYLTNWAKWWAGDLWSPDLVSIHIPKTGGESIEAHLSLPKDHRPAFTRFFCKPA